MPYDRRAYPSDWPAISLRIRARSGGQCECEGECGLHRHPPRRCEEQHGYPAMWAKGTIVLTVAHLNPDPMDCRPENLKAMCQRCHLRYDLPLHMRNAARTRRAKLNNHELFQEG